MRPVDKTLVYALLLAVGAVLWLGACEDPLPPDNDGTQPKALGLVANFLVKDDIDPTRGDKEDWRDFSTFELSDVKVTYLIGEKFGGGHKMSGVIELYDVQGNLMQRREVEPGVRNYDFEFRAEANKHYFFRFVARRGKANYMIENTVKPVDPCALCLAEEQCVEGRCVPAGACVPPCKSGETCQDGECVATSRCPRGQRWDSRKKECVARRADCDPPCGDNQICMRGNCVARVSDPGTPTGEDPAAVTAKTHVDGVILNVWPSGKGSMMLINRGSQHGIKKGASGSIAGGGGFTVKEVFPFQCKAFTNLTREQLAERKKVTIKL